MAANQEGLYQAGPWEHHTIHARGVGFHAVIAGDNPDRPTVILLHDFPLHWWSWRHQITALADAGYRVLALDLRGMGGSDLQPGSTELDELAQDVIAVANATGTSSFTVVGSGLGGKVAWTLAHESPEQLRSAVVINAEHPGERGLRIGTRAVSQARFVPRRLMDGSLVLSLLTEGAAPPSKEKMAGISHFYEEPLHRVFAANAALETHRAAVHPSASTKKILGRPIGVPLVVVTCEEDGLTKPNHDLLDRELRGPAFVEVTLENVGHYPNEEAPEELTALLLQYLGSLEDLDKS